MEIEKFYLIENIFENVTRTAEVLKYVDDKSATDLKQMKETLLQVCHEHIHYGSKNIEKRLKGMKTIYVILVFLNENVKRFHLFDHNEKGNNVYECHNTWDDMTHIQKELEELFEFKKESFPDEVKLIETLYEDIKQKSNVDYKDYKQYDRAIFFCVVHFYRIFEGWYNRVIVNDFYARSKEQIYDCQCNADKEAIKDLSKETNKDIAKLILNTGGGANNKRPM